MWNLLGESSVCPLKPCPPTLLALVFQNNFPPHHLFNLFENDAGKFEGESLRHLASRCATKGHAKI